MDLRVALFEDDPRYRATLEIALRHARGFECVASYPTLGMGLAAARTDVRGWDIVVMDLHLPDGSGIDGIRKLKALRPELAVVVLTVFEDPRTVMQAICAGADGYLLKRASIAELTGALRSVADGGSPLTPAVAASVLDLVRRAAPGPVQAPTPARLDLTDRERDVLRGLAAGGSYKRVAAELGVSIDTVREHIRALYRKLQVHSVAEAVGRALRDGLV